MRSDPKPAARGRALAALALATTCLPATAFAQDKPPQGPVPPPAQPAPEGEQPGARPGEKTIVLTPIPQGWGVLDLFTYIHRVTGRSILYDSQTNQKLKAAKVEFVGTHTIRESDLFDWLQSALSYNNLVLVPVGPRSPDGMQQWFCLDQNNPMVKTKPVYVDEEDIRNYEDRDGLYIVTTLTLKHIADTSRVRQALTTLTTQTASIGRIQDVPGSRAIIVGDFAPVVAAMKRLVEYIDVENPRIEPRMEVVELQNAVASELGPIITDLIESSDTAQRQRPQPQGGAEEEPLPKIIPDDRLDALIIYATERYMTKILELINQLDVPTRARGRLHFRPLKHTDAADMASLLEDLIDGADRAGTGGTRTTTGRRSTTGRSPSTPSAPGTPGGAAFGSSASEGKPVIIPDPKTNSLIIHASPSQFGAIDELIGKLDVSRPQVLIETALVELAVSDVLSLGVELFGTQGGIAVDSDGDGTLDTITNDRKGFGGTTYGLSELVTQDVNGVQVPVNRSPLFGTGLTAGIFNNGKLAMTLSALQTSGRAKILTRPSVVANDNEQASIKISRDTSYRENVRTDTGQNSDNFQTISAVSELKISPHISSEQFLRLEIEQTVANFGNRPSPDAPPDKTERTVSTNVTLPDTFTVVLGGVIQEETRSSVSKVPFFGDLPILGFFFRQTSDEANPTQLFLFVTPRILRDMDGFREYHQASWERKLLQDDLFGEEVRIQGTKFRVDPTGAPAMKPSEKLDALEKSGALDGARVKAPLSDEERAKAAREEYLRSQQDAGRTPEGGR
jgi:general secretion pathway protein D